MIITDDMNIEEIMIGFGKEYGEDFNWSLIVPSKSSYFVDELKRELGGKGIFTEKEICAVAKCDSNDDVLFFNKDGIWRIYHLTYSSDSTNGFPRCMEFNSGKSAAEYIQDKYIADRL